MRYLPEPVYDLDLVDRMYARTESSMNAKDLVVDDHAKGKEVEHIGEVVPHVGITIFSCALGIKAI